MGAKVASRVGIDSWRWKNKNAADCKDAGGGLLLPVSNCIPRYPKKEGPMLTREGANNGETTKGRKEISTVAPSLSFLFLFPLREEKQTAI